MSPRHDDPEPRDRQERRVDEEPPPEHQTIPKTGSKSGGKKMADARKGFGTDPASEPVPGAFGKERGRKE